MSLDPIKTAGDTIGRISDDFQRQPLRRSYMIRFIIRCIILVVSFLVFIFWPEQLEVVIAHKWDAFFKEFTIAHVIWIIWMIDMILQLIPLKRHIPIGSQKNFEMHYKPALKSINMDRLIAHLKGLSKGAYKVFILWAALIVAIGIFYHLGILKPMHLFLISAIFYVCDLICVLFWCPFRVFIMKNKCCTTCRIFNWDHLMMFSPLIYLRSFYAWVLVLFAVIVWALWELSVLLFPERFSHFTNESLKCSQCKDRLCKKPRGDRPSYTN
jgi:hypothetical protein